MTSSATSAPRAATPSAAPVRRARRDTEAPWVGGVASGLARHLAWPVVWVRAGFVVASVLSGLGVVLYAALWVVLPGADRFQTSTPGAEAAARDPRRPRRARRLLDAGPVVAVAVTGVGLLLLFQALGGVGGLLWPVLVGSVGVALLWRQADEAQRERWRDRTGRIGPLRLVLGRGGWGSWARVAIGLLLLVVAIGLGGLSGVDGLAGGPLPSIPGPLLAGALGVVGLLVVIGPWMVRLVADLGAEREERVRTQERADVAAHLHDSVLQTLALIQTNADDPATVGRLARSQERDLRAWLYVGDRLDETTLTGALRSAAAQVEDDHQVTVDVVAVGDAVLTDGLRPIVAAAGEAVTNAARHAATARVHVYAEVGADAVEVFVRDRGTGFDPERLPAGRHGVRHSIVDRMTRHGGTAEIRSAPGSGTEVRLRLPRPQPDQAETGRSRG